MDSQTLTGQRGIALVTVVLIVAIVTVASVAMVSAQYLDIRRASNMLESDQAWQCALFAEDIAMIGLREDDRAVDHLGEGWSQQAFLSLDCGEISGQLEDLQGRLNLNSLIKPDGSPSQADIERFKRLLNNLDITKPELVKAVQDWIDANEDPVLPGGAEDPEYMRLSPAYRTGNTLMASPSELRAVLDVDDTTYRKLSPFITALPEYTKVNINTALPDVLAVLFPRLGPADVEQIAGGEYGEVEGLLREPVLAGIALTDDDRAAMSVTTNYFLLQAMARFNNAQVTLYSVLKRDSDGKVSVIMRSRGVY